MAAGSTYTPIATTTLGSSANSYTFSSIPSTYTDLVFVATGTFVSGAFDVVLRFNGDTGSNYSATYLSGTGSAASSGRYSSRANIPLTLNSGFSTTQSTIITNIMNYSNATTYKTIVARGNNTGYAVEAITGLWRSTSAINSLTFAAATGSYNFAAGCVFTLYGLAAA